MESKQINSKVGSRFVVRLTARRSYVNLPMVSWPEKHMGFTTDLYNNNMFLTMQQIKAPLLVRWHGSVSLVQGHCRPSREENRASAYTVVARRVSNGGKVSTLLFFATIPQTFMYPCEPT